MAAQLASAGKQTASRLGALALKGSVSSAQSAYVPLPASAAAEPKLKSFVDHLNWEPQLPQRKNKSFKLNVGGYLSIPSADANAKPQYTRLTREQAAAALSDPFEGLPFRALAERYGDKVMPTLQAAKQQQRQSTRDNRTAAAQAQVFVPEVPHLLPFTRWAANSASFQATFVDDPKDRKKARLSWYHPDDTMVPRDWFRGGLLEDIKYYMPFGLGTSPKAAGQS